MAEHVPATILVIEDDATTRQTFQQILAEDGFTVHLAATAQEGFSELAQDPPDAVLLDLHLPLTNGLEWLRRVRAEQSRVPVAIVTGDYFLDADVAQELQTLGARIHFKPLWESDLKRLVHDLLDRRSDT